MITYDTVIPCLQPYLEDTGWMLPRRRGDIICAAVHFLSVSPFLLSSLYDAAGIAFDCEFSLCVCVCELRMIYDKRVKSARRNDKHFRRCVCATLRTLRDSQTTKARERLRERAV